MRRLLPLLLFGSLVVSGCDTVAEETVFLSPRDVTFEFRVDGSTLTVGQQATANAVASTTLEGNLDGFSLSELTAARVTAVRIRRLLPARPLNDLLQSAQISVVSGGSAQQVASGSSLGQGTEASLTTASADVASILRQSAFSGRMTFVPAQADAASEYIYRVTLTLALEVEGL